MKKTNTIFVSGNTAESDEFIPLIADGDDNFQVELPEGNIIPILPLRNIVLFPGIVLPVSIGRKKSLRLIKDVYKKEGFLGAIAQKEINVEEPEIKDLHTTGTIAQILRILEMPDGSTTVILQGKKRFNIKDIVE
ncbi:MAG: LON peptidase substrate-binding domain-containing protein, partial [Paludibacteraceae bacterium]|nr:LON peptidase substrate-binding domain-containing protein [Paludibacteraceae bacterium]